MMSTISRRLFVQVVLLLALVSGGVGILYSYGTRRLYISEQCKMLEAVYAILLEEDIPELCRNENLMKDEAEEDEWEEISDGLLERYENDNLRFRIRDENFDLLYATNKTSQAQDSSSNPEYNQKKMQRYSEEPEAIYEQNGSGGRVVLRGKHVWEGMTYYIIITESTSLINRSTVYAQKVLLLVVAAFLILGTLSVRIISRGIGRPVEEAARITRKIANKDFSEHVEEKTKYRELNELGDGINMMSQQIQNYIQDLENFNRLLQQDNVRRAELEEHRKRFVNNVSHELKTPLAIISGQVELLPMISDTDKREQYCSSIMEEIRRMSDMINSMLQIFSVEQGLENVPMQSIALEDIARNVLEDFQPLFARKQIHTELKADGRLQVQGNEENIRRAMNNFLMNAYRYAPEKSKVNVSVTENGGYVIYSVYNDGQQIEEKDLKRIWDSFYQGNAISHGSGVQGTGLGLYIVKSIVAQHGGVCGVENKAGGVEFWFGIPK
ncbi:MAG: HAMP domain-containing sensor histidine kinase [Lachnospiraceae bacterium]|nr:HAMP domain-containing sensor histidine kinase [Lachnospiraceae bacterium]